MEEDDLVTLLLSRSCFPSVQDMVYDIIHPNSVLHLHFYGVCENTTHLHHQNYQIFLRRNVASLRETVPS